MPRRQRMIIDLSVKVLRAATVRSAGQRVDSIEVRLALWCLVGHCAERWPLDLFWDSAGQENDIGRAQGVTAAFNGVVRQLRLARRYEDATPSVDAVGD